MEQLDHVRRDALIQRNNTLFAEIEIAAASTIIRRIERPMLTGERRS